MHEIDEQVADRFRFLAGPRRSDLSPTAEAQTGAARRPAATLSVRLLEARERDPDAALLNVHGELDLETAPMLREVLLPVLERETGPVVVDLSEVVFMDSTGVHVLVDTLRWLERQNRRFAIVCRQGGQVHRLLALVGLLNVLTVHRSRESAVTAGDDVLRSEPRTNGQTSDASALTQTRRSARQTTEC